jgi:hypothetical protein
LNRRSRQAVFGAAVAVVGLVGAVVVVREVFGCSPPRDQAAMIKLYQVDPLLAVVPPGGRLVDEYAHSYTCDSGLPHGGSPTSPGFAEVMRLYKLPTTYSQEQLRLLFDGPAAAAGWRPVSQPGLIAYCKQVGPRVSYAYVSTVTYPVEPGVEVTLSAASEPDSRMCSDGVHTTDPTN